MDDRTPSGNESFWYVPTSVHTHMARVQVHGVFPHEAVCHKDSATRYVIKSLVIVTMTSGDQ